MKTVAVDVETDSLEARYDKNKVAHSLAFAYRDDDGLIKSQAYPWGTGIKRLKHLQRTFDPLFVFHRASFDIAVIETHSDVTITKYDDTKLLMYVLDPTRDNGLVDLGRLVGLDKLDSPSFSKLTPELLTYNKRDAEVCLLGYELLRPQLEADERLLEWYTYGELPFVRIVIEMENTGFFIDMEALKSTLTDVHERHRLLHIDLMEQGGIVPGKKVKTKYHRKAEEVSEEPVLNKYFYTGEMDDKGNFVYQKWSTFNPNSTANLQWVLEQQGWKPSKLTSSGKAQLDANTLESISEPIARTLLSYRELDKIKGTYLEPFFERTDDQHILRGSFNQHIARTGRLSSSQPNLMNLPAHGELGKKLRQMIATDTTRDMWLVQGDLN